MHPFPSAADLRFLVGKEIEQIALDPMAVQFRLADGGQITVEGAFEHVDAQGRSHTHQDGEYRDVGPFYVGELIQQVITLVSVDPFCLTLAFGNGSLLRIRSDEGPYECGQIRRSRSDDDLIVF